MRTIYKIAKTELQMLFYSPIAWMIIVIFVFQTGMIFTDLLREQVKMQSIIGELAPGVTSDLFAGEKGVFTGILSSLYLYIPLLTMGLMSREFSSGSIKLLYNAPITNRQIILGKYLSTLIYGLVLVFSLFVFTVFASMKIEHFAWGHVLSGLLGIYLLICVYSAIGLFMSSLTSYQLVAALCTLSLLGVLNYVGGLWQNIDFVRDLTYWLSMSGRAQKFISGLICSEDVLYFIVLILLFLAWTIIQLQAARQKSRWTVTWGKFLLLFIAVIFLGYFTSRPRWTFFYDATPNKMMSLTPESQKMMKQLDGKLTVTTYGDIMENSFGLVGSRHINKDLELFKKYTRFKPEMKMKYVYYYPKETNAEDVSFAMDFVRENPKKIFPSDQLEIPIDSFAEGIGIIRVFEREDGQKEMLPMYNDPESYPNEADFMTMFRRFLVKAPKVGFVVGHGERSIIKRADWDYGLFSRVKNHRASLINAGIDPVETDLKERVPEDVKVLIFADTRGSMTEVEKENLQEYIDRGGNLFITAKPRRSEDIEQLLEQFGVTFVPGCLVYPNDQFAANIVLSSTVSESAEKIGGELGEILGNKVGIIGESCCALEYTTDKGFSAMPLFRTADKGVWNEMETTNFVDDTVKLNPHAGEIEKSYITGLALSRDMGNKQQKMVIFGNADYFSNEGLIFRATRKTVNEKTVTSSFEWLLDGYRQVTVERPELRDDKITMTRKGAKWLGLGFMGIYPGLLLLLAIGLWVWRRNK